MRKSRRKNGCASVVLIVVLIVVIATIFILAKDSFAGNEQNKPPETTNILILVNKDNKLPDDYKVGLTTIESLQVAKVLLDDLNEMRKAAEKENIFLYIRSAYRTPEEQEKVFSNTFSGYVNQGNSKSVAMERAEQVAARPGYSEHQTGLAIDFSLGTNAEKQVEMWEWLSKNSYKYGFILRYPEGKEHITGYAFEPWHYRYVGREHAQSIYDKGLLFEEYIAFFILSC